MLYTILKFISRIAVNVYYRKIAIENIENLPQKGAILVVANHPNTLMDPIVTALLFNEQLHFLANASLFRKPVHNWIMTKLLNMIPIFRKQDLRNASDLNENKAIFQKCYEFLAKQGFILIFPEGTSFSERRLRPLKTGAARIALGGQDLTNIKIAIVGLNYSDPVSFRSDLFINIGKTIYIKNFMETNEQKTNKAALSLSQEIEKELKGLIIHTETPEEDQLIRILEYLYKTKKTSLKENFLETQHIIKAWKEFEAQNPEKSELVAQNLRQFDTLLTKNKLKIDQLSPNFRIKVVDILYLLAFPLAALGAFFNYLPYKIPDWVAKKLTKDIEFHAPIRMLIGIVSFSFFYAFWGIFFYFFILKSFYFVFFLVILPLLGSISLRYTESLEKLMSLLNRQKLAKKGILEEIFEKKCQIDLDLEEWQKIWNTLPKNK